MNVNVCTESQFLAWKNGDLFFNANRGNFYTIEQLKFLIEEFFEKTSDKALAQKTIKSLNIGNPKEFIPLVNQTLSWLHLYTYEAYKCDYKITKYFPSTNNKMIGFVKFEPRDNVPFVNYDDNIKMELDIILRKHTSTKEKHRVTRKNEVNHKKKLEKTAKKISGYPAPAYKITVKDKKGKNTYTKRFWKSNGKKSSYAWFKKQANRNVRRVANAKCHEFRNLSVDKTFFNDTDDFDICEVSTPVMSAPQHNAYKKCYDLWWSWL